MNRRRLVAAGLLALAATAQAQENIGPIKMVVPFGPGTTTDTVGRVVADALAKASRQSVVVDNRAGAGGATGTDQVAKAAADGKTLVMGTVGTHAINAALYPKMPYDTLKDFAAVTKLGDAALILVAHPSAGVKTLRDLVEQGKSRPFSYGSSGTGGTPHLLGELLKQRTGAQLQHVPYKGGGQAMADVLGGQIPLVFTAIATAQQYVRNGRVIALGVPQAKRSNALPEVPTFNESGFAGFDVASWTGIFAPAATPRPVVERLQKEIAALLKTDFVRERYATLGIEPVGNTPEEFTAQVRGDLARWAEVVKAANVRVE